MSDDLIAKLRVIRQRAERLSQHLVADLRPFRHRVDNVTFRRRPDSDSKPGDVNVTTTSTVFMALAPRGKLEAVIGSDAFKGFAETFARVVSAAWRSSELPDPNAFT